MEPEVYKAIVGGKRLGIMGGTFDPIHYGHLVAAETARVEFNLDNVLFIPAGKPPHKLNHRITDASERFTMVQMSIKNNSYFKVSNMEIVREGPTYTVDTLKILHELLPDQELYFITGTDALLDLLTWREPDTIVKLAKIIGASRPGYDSRNFFAEITKRYPYIKDRIFELEVPALAISSTDIRARVKNNKSIRYLLPEEVRLYIEERNLYK